MNINIDFCANNMDKDRLREHKSFLFDEITDESESSSNKNDYPNKKQRTSNVPSLMKKTRKEQDAYRLSSSNNSDGNDIMEIEHRNENIIENT